MAKNASEQDSGLRRIWGLVLIPVCVFILLSLVSYDWRDIGLLHAPPNDPPGNLIGPVGAWLAFAIFMAFGIGAYLVPAWCLVFGTILLFDREERVWPRGLWSGVAALSLILLLALGEDVWAPACEALNITQPAGLFGRLLMMGFLVHWLSPVGATILVACLLGVAIVFLIEIRNLRRLYEAAAVGLNHAVARLKTAMAEPGRTRRTPPQSDAPPAPATVTIGRPPLVGADDTADAAKDDAPDSTRKPRRERRTKREKKKKAKDAAADAQPSDAAPAPTPATTAPSDATQTDEDAPSDGRKPAYVLPGIDLLNETPAGAGVAVDVESVSQVLVTTLGQFGIEVEVTNVQKGPVVTRFELLPAPGVRVEKIAGLNKNLAMALKAEDLRVQAPVPGKGVIGIEVPNTKAKLVCLREIMETTDADMNSIKVPLFLGKDVGGANLVADLADMPHLLVAGATGAGKTVCSNSILAGLLMSRTPEQLRLLLIDPKIVEFSVYNHLPHLVVPVITDPSKVQLGLRWAINEMDKRYKLFARVGVRNIEGYNKREVAKQVSLFEGEPEEDEGAPPDRLPYIVLIIDELADLMLSKHQADIESSIARLAQLSRAVGIHMILSTQRPSVDVITGTIKANFPARIAFQVAQKTDSRTILDSVGAEALLGRGDMLFLPPGSSRLIRAQGALSTDEEIRRIVSFIKKQSEPEYEEEIKEKLESSGGAPSVDVGEEDEFLAPAVEIIRETKRASTSSLQRRLRIGYTRAARIMDILEERGIIGPPRGSEPREILIDLDGDIPDNPATDENNEPQE